MFVFVARMFNVEHKYKYAGGIEMKTLANFAQ